jgi:hypothetical protein
MPDLLHIVPLGDNAVLNRVLLDKDTRLGARFAIDVGVLVLPTGNSLDVIRRPTIDENTNRVPDRR